MIQALLFVRVNDAADQIDGEYFMSHHKPISSDPKYVERITSRKPLLRWNSRSFDFMGVKSIEDANEKIVDELVVTVNAAIREARRAGHIIHLVVFADWFTDKWDCKISCSVYHDEAILA